MHILTSQLIRLISPEDVGMLLVINFGNKFSLLHNFNTISIAVTN
jgi:hypothetical protein